MAPPRPTLSLFLLLLAPFIAAQQSQSSTATSTTVITPPSNSTANVTSIATSVPVTRTSVTRGSTLQITSFVSTTIVSTLVPNVTATATPTANATAANATATPTPSSGPVLDTRVDPGFGVVGALLILTGLPSVFLGHKNRWSSFFLTGFYTFALVCLALILKFGVLVAIHPPNQTLRGLFVLACGVAGIAGGGVSIFFWQQAKYFIGAWGGFSVGLFVQCFRDGGLIRPLGFRWILYIGCAAVGFVACTIPKWHYHTLIAGTAITGASAFMLGVDCFTTAGLKEFYVNNLGFSGLFPKFAGMSFPLSQTMQVELGLIAAVALVGVATQLRVLVILKRKLAEINEEERKRELAAEAKAVVRFEHVQRDLEEWEKEHGSLASHTRNESGFSGMPLMKDMDDGNASTPGGDSTFGRSRARSGASELGPSDTRPLSRFSQNPGLLPAMNLGLGLDSELPEKLVGEDLARSTDPEILKKEELLAEIQTIRKSIDALRSEGDSVSGDSRRPSMSMHSRTLSGDMALTQVQGTSRLRASSHQRDRVHSMDILSSDNRASAGAAIGRPISTPLRDDDWDAYVRERKLFQPPSGQSAPIATTPIGSTPLPSTAVMNIPDAVTDALSRRQRRESAFELGGPSKYANEALELGLESGNVSQSAGHLDVGLAPPQRTHKRSSTGGPVNILPPRPVAKAEVTNVPMTRTYEELMERHQEKIRSLQEPLSKQEQAQADLAVAKSRWQRSKAAEKDAVTRRQAEKEAALAKRTKEEGKRPRGDGPRAGAEGKHPRSLSTDLLGPAGKGSGGRRASTAKVQEWQKYQQEVAKDPQRLDPNDQGVLPFPNSSQQPVRTVSTGDRRRMSRSGVPRDPPS